MVTMLYHPSFAVIPFLRGNSDALNQSHLSDIVGGREGLDRGREFGSILWQVVSVVVST